MGMSCFDTPSVMGWRRVPEPPARMMPFMPRQHTIGPRLERPRGSGSPGRGGFAYPARVSVARDTARERVLRIVRGPFGVRRGQPLPYGAAARRDGVNFSVFSKHATE